MVLSLWSGVIHGFCDRALILPSCPVFMWVRAFECARSVRSLVCVPCLMLEHVFGSRYSCLEFWLCQGSDTRSMFCLIVWVCGLEFTQPRSLLFTCVMLCVVAGSSCFIGCVHSCYVLCCVACSLCISLAVSFHVVMSCVNTWLMSILISCVFVSSFAHGWRFVLLAICLCFCFVWAHGFCLSFLCAMCSHVNCLDPTHLVSWFLVNLPHLSSLTLLVYSLYNLLVFPVLPCQACQLCCFSPLRGSLLLFCFCLFLV